MSGQIPLFVDDYYGAVRAAVEALGGFKRVGSDMKPDLAVEAAGRWLADCLNPEKREKLSLTELAYIRKAARQAGFHVLAAFEAQDAGYAEPQPLNPEDEAAKLQREFIASVKALEALQNRMTANTRLQVVA